MNSLAYEIEERELDGQRQVLKTEGSIAGQFDDTSDEDASLFEIHDSEEDLEEVAPEACSMMSEPQVPSLQVNGQLINDNYQGYKEDDDEGGFLFEGMEKHSSSDDGYTNEDNAASVGHLAKEDGEDSYIDRRTCETFRLQVPHKAYVSLSEAGKERYNRQEDLIYYGGSKRREGVLEIMGTNLGCIFQNPETKESLSSHIVNLVPSSVKVDESEQCVLAMQPEEENQEACEVTCSSPVYPCSRSKDSKLSMMEMEIKDRSCEPFAAVSELDDLSHAAAEGLVSTVQTLKVCVNEDVDKKLLPFALEDERISSIDIKTSMRGAQEAAAIGNKNKDFESCTHESSLSCGVQQETSSFRATDRSCPPDKLLIHKGFEVGPMRITRSMSMGKYYPKSTGDVRLDRSGFGFPVGKRTGKRTAARGVRSVWGTGMGLPSLTGDVGVVQPRVSLKNELVGKDNLGHVKLSIGPVWMQRKGRGKGKCPVSGKPRVVQEEHVCHDSTDDSTLEGGRIKPAKNLDDVQISHGSMAGQSMTGLRKTLSKKMQAAGTVDSMKPRVSRARKRSNCRNKSNSGKGQEDGEVRPDSNDFINNHVLPTYVDLKLETDCELPVHKITSTETGLFVVADMVPEVFCQSRVTSMAAVMEGSSIECVESGCVGSRMPGDFAGFQKSLGQTLQCQGNMENGSQVDSGNRSNDTVGGKIVHSLASSEAMTETINNVGKHFEEKWESQELVSRVESELITRIEGYGEAAGMHLKEEEGLVLLFDKDRGGEDEQRSPQRVQLSSKHCKSIRFVDEEADIDSLRGSLSTEAVPNGKGPEKSVLTGDMVEFDQHCLKTNGGINSSWQSKCLKLPTSEHLEDLDEDSFRDISIANSIGSEKGRKCAQFGEDAGSATSPGGVAKVGIDCLQPEIKSQMRGRGSKKGKAKGGSTLANTGDLKINRCVQDSLNARNKGEPSRSKKNSKQINCFQGGEACVQSRCELDKKVAGHRTKSKKGVVMQACLENALKDKPQMELQVQKKRKRHGKGIAIGLELIEAAGSCEFNRKAGKSRKNIVDTSKVASNVLKRNPLGRRKKEVTEPSKMHISGVLTRETDGTSTVAKKQMNFSKSKKGGKEKIASPLEAKVVENDTHNLRSVIVADTDFVSYERCRMSSSKPLPHMGDQTSEGTMTTLKDSKFGEVRTESVVAERHCFTEMGDVESSVVAKKAREGEFFGDLATIGSRHRLDSYSGLEKASYRLLATGELNITTIGEDVCSGVTEGECPDQGTNVSTNVEESAGTKAGSAGVGWVMCDDCRKWRCISTELADIIEATDARWTCLDNPNKEFADCSIPQEKSSTQINAELDLSDDTVDGVDEDMEAAVDSKSVEGFQGSQPTTWTLTRHNIFRHRRRKTHDNDDSVICHCKPPEDDSPGCGDSCINRMVSVECVPDICPCGEACSNQQFRKRMYANVALFRCGKKGFGLKVLENVPKGSFITEYVGEVVDMPTFEARQKEYACNGQKHFYFMTLNSNEVIDAYAKGNLGRFINHSCEPNCQTEKWWVNGEICIGLFAIRDLAQGEEITFDYHYEPVYGAAAKKCHCGSSQCRGYIGGQPLDPDSIAESDSDDEEDPEPVMLEEESEEEAVNFEEKSVVSARKFRGVSEATSWEPKMARAGRLKRKRSFGTKPDDLDNCLKNSSQSKRPKDSTFVRKNPGTKGLFSETNVGRQDWGRPSRSILPSEVERKLDALLDAHGGLVKRKDVAKHYMRLLVLSTASGESVQGGPSWSVRDLSLLLDAVLKTSSRSVLSDILHKNGLQLLHNLVKQSRRNWKKIPILRKLMKVLELLSARKVLTERHISCIPSRPGMESFMESIFELTRHDDNEVQQIARRFKTKWFPVGAVYSRHSFGEKHSKSQPWCSSFQQPRSQQKMSEDFSSPTLPDESMSPKSSQQHTNQSKCWGSFVQTERRSSFDDMLHPASGISENPTPSVEGKGKSSENHGSYDASLPNGPNVNILDQEPRRRKRVSRWDKPAITDNICPERQQHLEGDAEPPFGGKAGLPEDVHQSLSSSVPHSGIGFDSCRQSSQGWNYYDQSADDHKLAVQNKVVQLESSHSLPDPQTTKIDSRKIIMSERVDCSNTQQQSKKPHCWFKRSARPPRAQLSSQHSVMRSGALPAPPQGISLSPSKPGSHQTSVQVGPKVMQAGAPQAQPFMGRVPPQQCYLPPMPIGPFPGPQGGTCPPAPRGKAFSSPPCRQPHVQLPVSPSSAAVPPHLQRGPMQMSNGASHAPQFIPPRTDSGNAQKTSVRGPGQVHLARAVFQSALPATSPGFISGFKNQGKFQSLQGPSGGTRPHNAARPFQLSEPFHCQGPPSLSAKKLPMGRLGPLVTGGSRHERSEGGDKDAAVCRESMGEFEPEPPVPGL